MSLQNVHRKNQLQIGACQLLVRLDGRDEELGQSWRLFRFNQRFHADLTREAGNRIERKWQRKPKQYADAM